MPFIDTMHKEYDYLLFIGRFQIPHHGHFHIMKAALEKSRYLILGVGSINLSRSLKNPFTFEERVEMIVGSGVPEISEAYKEGRIILLELEDMPYKDEAWVNKVKRKVEFAVGKGHNRTGLIGCSKDSSSYYLNLFPNWPSISVPVQGDWNSTRCRNGFFDVTSEDFHYLVSATTTNTLLNLSKWIKGHREQYDAWYDEHKFIVEYKKSWERAPFPPTFNTVDAVVFHQDNVLVIKRGDHPGKGLFAVPGGFINLDETQFDSCMRELREETGCFVVEDNVAHTIAPYLIEEKTFGAPGRDPRGRTITQAFCFRLPTGCTPVIEAGDDAAEVMWRPWKSLKSNEFISDHYWMIEYFAEKYID